MYIQYMLCPKQEFITEPAKPKMNPIYVCVYIYIYVCVYVSVYI